MIYFAFCRFAVTKSGLWLSRNIAWKLDPLLLRVSRGRLSSTGPVASAVLETTGARTGRRRRTTTLYFHDGDRVTIIASKMGSPADPSWFYNVRANPDVLFGNIRLRAVIVEDERERQRLWALADRVFPPFVVYREWAAADGRTIPIVQLIEPSPRAQASA